MRKFYKYKNGAILIYRKNKLSKATAIRFGITRGGALDNDTGISHLVEHMLFKGTSTKSKEQLDEDIRLNISSINASTGSNALTFKFYESSKQFIKALEITSDCFLHSNFPEAELEKEKQVVLQEIIKDKDNQNRIAFRNMWISAYDYKEQKSRTLGDEEKMVKLTQKQLLNYKKNNFIDKNFIACVSTNISFLKAKKLIKKYLIDKLETGEKNTYSDYDVTINGNSKLSYEFMDRNKVKILIGIPTVGFLDLKKNFIVGLLLKYLNGIKSPMWQIFREYNQLVYSLSAGRSTVHKDGLIYFDFETSPDKVNKCFDALGELFKTIKSGISEKDVDRLKRNYKEFKDKNIRLPYDECMDDLYEYLGYDKLIKEKEFSFEKKSITKENVDNAILDLLNFDKIFVSVVGNIKKQDIYTINKISKILKETN